MALDPATALLVFGTILGGGLGLGLGGNFVARRARLRNAQAAWSAFAERNGLVGGDSTEGAPLRLWYAGAWQGRSVAVAAGVTTGGGWTTARVMFDPPLDLGLVIGPRNSSRADVWTRAGLDLAADEPLRANQLFDDGVLLAARGLGRYRWNANDTGIYFGEPSFVADPSTMGFETGVQRAIDLANAIEHRRAQLPPARMLAPHADAWQLEARRHGYVFGTTPLSMRGTVDGIPVTAFSYRADHEAYGLGAYATFSQPLQGAVGLAPTKPGELAFWLGIGEGHPGTQDWELGDTSFDRAFIVRARDPQKLAKILPPSLCTRLVRLHERYPLVVDDVALRLASRHLPPADVIPPLMREIAEIAAEIELNAIERKPQAGPYR